MINAHSLGGRLAALVASALLVGTCVAGVALIELRGTINGYEHLLATDVQDRADARRMQVTFKKQVQEWKDILIRGEDAASLQKYTSAFRARSHDVDSMAAVLAGRIADTVSHNALVSFARAHRTMATRYDEALLPFEASGGRSMHESDRIGQGSGPRPHGPHRLAGPAP